MGVLKLKQDRGDLDEPELPRVVDRWPREYAVRGCDYCLPDPGVQRAVPESQGVAAVQVVGSVVIEAEAVNDDRGFRAEVEPDRPAVVIRERQEASPGEPGCHRAGVDGRRG